MTENVEENEIRYHHEFTQAELEQLMYHWDDNAAPVQEYHYMKKKWQTPDAVIGGKKIVGSGEDEKPEPRSERDGVRENAVDSGHRTAVDLNKDAPADEEPVPLWLDTSSSAIVVEFYAAWCAHCQHFKSEYISVAREVTRRAIGTQIHFHAVSCQLYREVCRAYNIDGFPVVLGYAMGESIEDVGWELNPRGQDMTAELIANALSFTLAHEPKDVHALNFSDSNDERAHQRVLSEMGHQAAAKKRDWHESLSNVNDAFHNGAVSLAFALKTGVFMKREGVLEEKRRIALRDFLGLVDWAMPPQWHVREMVQEVMAQLDKIVGDPSLLVEIVERHQSRNVEPDLWGGINASNRSRRNLSGLGSGSRFPSDRILNDPEAVFWKNNRWTESCTHSEPGMGFTCGLWSLFHCITIGSSMPSRQLYGFQRAQLTSPRDVAEIIKRFIGNFFACDVCRWNFLDMYDRCEHDRCHRLIGTIPALQGGEPELKSSRELALWLWETHNAVNVRVMKEAAERENRHLTSEEREAAAFPTVSMCPACWHDETMTNFDEKAVFAFLQSRYWPENKARSRIPILPVRRQLAIATSSNTYKITAFTIFLISLAILTQLCRRFLKRMSSKNPRKSV